MDVIDSETLSPNASLQPWEEEIVALFTAVASIVGFRKSVGAIYGYMFCQEDPMNLEVLMKQLGMSKGTVSQGLAFLRKAGAVKLTYKAGDRREHFVPEISLKRLVAGFLRDQLYPQVERGSERLDSLEAMIRQWKDEVPEVIIERTQRLRSWHRQSRLLLPIVQRFIDSGMERSS